MSLSDVRRIKSADKERKYGFVAELKAAGAACDPAVTVSQIDDDLQNITTNAANLNLPPNKCGQIVCHFTKHSHKAPGFVLFISTESERSRWPTAKLQM